MSRYLTVGDVLARDTRPVSRPAQQPEPKWVKIDSENLKSIVYDPDTRVLVVKFQNDALYGYKNVSSALYAGLQKAESPTAYLRRFIIPNHKAARLK